MHGSAVSQKTEKTHMNYIIRKAKKGDNPSAVKSYTDFGFIEFRREKVKFTKIVKIFMKYTRLSEERTE